MCKLIFKVKKLGNQEVEQFRKEIAEYKESDEYKEIQAKSTVQDDDEDKKDDKDPKGYVKFGEVLDGKADFSQFVEMCARSNPKNAAL